MWERITLTAKLPKMNVELHDNQRFYCSEIKKRTQFHKVYGWHEIPNSKYFEVRNKKPKIHSYNHLGFRGSLENPEKLPVVMVLGDSMVRGTIADDLDTMPEVMNRFTDDFKFLNFGMGGTGTINQYLIFRENYKEFNPSIVVLFISNSNDIENNLEGYNRSIKNHPRPYTINDNNEIILLKEAERKSKILYRIEDLKEKKNKNQNFFTKNFQKFKDFLRNNTKLYLFYHAKVKELFIRKKDGSNERVIDYELGFEITEKILINLNNLIKNEGEKLIILDVPEPYEIDKKKNYSRHEDAKKYGKNLRNFLGSLADKENFIFFTPLDTLKEKQSNDGDVFGFPDMHLNEFGYYTVAEFLINKMYDLNIIHNKNNSAKFNVQDVDPLKINCAEY